MTALVLDHVLILLIPFFLKAAHGNQDAARSAALELLESYAANTEQELLLAAEIIALSFATLHNLGRTMAEPALSATAHLRLCANANALNRAAERNRQRLAARQGAEPAAAPAATRLPAAQITSVQTIDTQPADAPPVEAPPPALPAAVQKVRDAIVEAAPMLAETLTGGSQTLSRQQRRFIARKAEEARAAQQREARRAARLAERAQQRAGEPQP